MSNNTRTFYGADWTNGKVRAPQTSGKVRAGWNRDDRTDNEVFLDVYDGLGGSDNAFVLFDEATALDLLHHLNDLLGKPLGIAPTAGMAPSAD